ncbi:MAG: LacI family DNA-binding transcriptional regulator [Prolixibacteraceae bacterium]|nr:LacI family DNA-binding transcriptional regulator [Prolixibacteraceae bacterium]
MEKRSVTIIDIAKFLGLSKSTVSRALKNHPDISNETKEAVKKIAKELNYIKNTTASSLRYKKSNLIGLIVPEISYFFFPSVIDGIEYVVHNKGYNLLILQSNEMYEREVENIDILISNNVEGILASVSRTTKTIDHFKHLTDINLPLVLFDRIVNEINADIVLVDDIDGAYNAVKHLLEAGKKRIAICTGNLNLLISRNRLFGYKKVLTDSGIDIDESMIIAAETSEDAEKKFSELLKMNPSPDGIFAISDLTMAGVMKAIYKSRKRIPEDIAVIGFCEEQYRTMYHPTLTAIDPMGFEIGKVAAELLFEQIQQNSNNLPPLEPRTVYLKGELIKGESA